MMRDEEDTPNWGASTALFSDKHCIIIEKISSGAWNTAIILGHEK
jgi:hypothetical protein